MSGLPKNIYEEIISDFAKQRVLVIGDLMVDKYVIGDVERISPEAPVQVVEVRKEELAPGGAGNVVRNLRSLGAKVSVLSVVGSDKEGDWLFNEFDKLGADGSLIFIDSTRPTTLKERIVVNHQQILRIDRESKQPIGASYEDMMIDYLEMNMGLRLYDVVLISDYAKGVVTERVACVAIEKAKEMGEIVVVDPKGLEWGKYIRATVICPNEKEIGTIYEATYKDKMSDAKKLEMVGHHLIKELELEALLVTKGEKGMSLFERSSNESPIETLDVKTKAKDVFDVTGAGDTAISVFSLALAVYDKYYEAVQLANVAAGIVVGKVGTSTVNREELLKEILSND